MPTFSARRILPPASDATMRGPVVMQQARQEALEAATAHVECALRHDAPQVCRYATRIYTDPNVSLGPIYEVTICCEAEGSTGDANA